MWNSPTLNFDGCASAWNAPSSASSDDAQAEHRAVVLERHLAVHVEVAREPRGDEVLGRSSIHFTGRPSSSDAAVATTYPG